MFHRINKKGIFLPLFVFATIFILGVLFYIIRTTESEKQDLVGLKAITLGKLYDETEKTMLYLNLAAEYSSDKAAAELAENGGYSTNNRCEKTEEGYVIWNSCPVLNPSEEFAEQLKKELKNYIIKYESSYKSTDFQNMFGLARPPNLLNIEIPAGIDDVYNYIYTRNVRNSNIITNDYIDNNLFISLSDIIYPIENSGSSTLILKPKIKVSRLDTSLYGKIYNTVRSHCINKEFLECENNIKNKFAKATITQNEKSIKINIPIGEQTIKFIIISDKKLQEYQDIYDFSDDEGIDLTVEDNPGEYLPPPSNTPQSTISFKQSSELGNENIYIKLLNGGASTNSSSAQNIFLLDDLNLQSASVIKTYLNSVKEGKNRNLSNIDLIVLHHTGGYAATGAISTLKQRGLSAHYVLDRNGDLYYLVPENVVAWHAGCCRNQYFNTKINNWTSGCCPNITNSGEIICKKRFNFCIERSNSRSIGIEIVNTGTPDDPITEDQYVTLNQLLPYLTQKLNIPYDDEHIIGHYQITDNKDDPINLEWGRLNLTGHITYAAMTRAIATGTV